MSTKAYLMVNVNKKLYKNPYQPVLRDLFIMSDVESIERVNGTCDLVVQSKYPNRIRYLADEILAKEWCDKLSILMTEPAELHDSVYSTTI